MYHMLRVDFGGVDWFFWFTWGRISTERRERERRNSKASAMKKS